MKSIDEFIQAIQKDENQTRFQEVINWVQSTFPQLELEIKWNQPMFIDHGTFIIAFSVAKNHFSVAPEKKGMDVFRSRLEDAGYNPSKMLFKIKWSQDIDYDLLEEIIQYNIDDKASVTSFWRS